MSKTILLLIGILILAAFLIFFRLESRPLYGDELFTMDRAVLAPPVIVSTNYSSILYPLPVHFLLPLGNAEFMARFPAALFGLFSVLAVYLLGGVFFEKKEALLAALLIAVSTETIYFSQQARAYTGLLLFSLFSFYFFQKALKERRIVSWIFYVLTTTIGVYLHFFLLIIISVHASYMIFLWIKESLQKTKHGEASFNSRQIFFFAMGFLVIAGVTFLLYWPTRNIETGPNLFAIFPRALANIFSGETSIKLLPFISETFKRLLDYASSPFFFFLEWALFFIGVAASWKSLRRELMLFLLYFALPFLFFVLSNPSGGFQSMQDNKFIFILPLFFLFVSKGITCCYAGLVHSFSKLEKTWERRYIPRAVFVVFALVFLWGEGLCLHGHFVHLRLFGVRVGGASAYLDDHVQSAELMMTDGFADKFNFLILSPMTYEGRPLKRAMIIEGGSEELSHADGRRQGLWGLYRRSLFSDEDIQRLKAFDAGIEIKSFRRTTLIHLQGTSTTLLEKILFISRHVMSRPQEKDREPVYRLFLAKVYLLAGKIPEARKELDLAAPFLSYAEEKGTGPSHLLEKIVLRPERREVQKIAQSMLAEQIAPLLVRNAYQSFIAGHDQEALSILWNVEAINPRGPKVLFWFHFTRASILSRLSRMEEAFQEVLKAFPLCHTDQQKLDTIRLIRELYARPFGYMILRQGGIVHIRWWSDKKRTFSGSITASSSMTKPIEIGLSPKARLRLEDGKFLFKGEAELRKIKGWDLSLKESAELSFDLKIDGRKGIADNILYVIDGHISR